jgi:hypothetical protein
MAKTKLNKTQEPHQEFVNGDDGLSPSKKTLKATKTKQYLLTDVVTNLDDNSKQHHRHRQ